jgi:hypothetical protein
MKAKTKPEELQQEASELEQIHDSTDAPTQADIQERIRQRAYEISQNRGADGDEVSDWYQAEAEIYAALGPAEFEDTPESQNRMGAS